MPMIFPPYVVRRWKHHSLCVFACVSPFLIPHLDDQFLWISLCFQVFLTKTPMFPQYCILFISFLEGVQNSNVSSWKVSTHIKIYVLSGSNSINFPFSSRILNSYIWWFPFIVPYFVKMAMEIISEFTILFHRKMANKNAMFSHLVRSFFHGSPLGPMVFSPFFETEAALLNPLPPLGLAPELRPQVLAAPDAAAAGSGAARRGKWGVSPGFFWDWNRNWLVVWNLCFFHSVGNFIITDELHDFPEGYTTNQEKKSENWGETGRQVADKNRSLGRPWKLLGPPETSL